jgi:hypothetical protein
VFDQNNFVYQKLIVYLKFLAILLFQVRRTRSNGILIAVQQAQQKIKQQTTEGFL